MLEVPAARGYTAIQVALFEQRYCIPNEHRFGPFNVPMPDGTCPFCIDAEFREAMSRAGAPEAAPDVALTSAELAAMAARTAIAGTPQTLTGPTQSQPGMTRTQRMARVRRHRMLRRSIARRSVG